MHKLRKLFPLVGAILALALVSCGSDSDDGSETDTQQKSAGSISYATTTVSKTTDDEAFTNALTKTGDGTVTYASSKTDVAEVNTQTGLVTIKGAGETTITATVADSESYTYAVKTASYTLTVTAADTAQQKSAGSISYATTTVSKTTADAAFTNELTKTGDGTVTYASDNTAVATVDSDGLVTIFGAGTATITATVADSDTYTYATKTASYTLTVTQAVTYIGTKAPTEAKAVGDIVFSDGSATPYADGLTLTTEQKEAAISVIFYAGTGLNSGDDNTTSRTLGVGLAQKSGLAWCVSDAKAYSLDIDTIQCPASGPMGNLTFTTGDRNGSDNLSQISVFLRSKSSADDADDTAKDASYPSFYFAKNYKSQTGSRVSGTDYESGWYLPSIAELFQIWTKRTDLNKAVTLCAGTGFKSELYWSSSQSASDNDCACSLNFSNGFCNSTYYKTSTSKCVCAVRAFN